MEIVIGTRKWSTWSLRPWLALRRTGADFTEVLVTLRQENDMSRAAILAHSPSGQVPALKAGGLVIVDSLAICEYLAEAYPDASLWPADRSARALARAAAAEMHAGFQALRAEHPMALEVEPRVTPVSPAAAANVRRIVELWLGLQDRFGGPFLAGGWSIADAFYTPVATRFRTYGIDLGAHGDDGRAQAYVDRLLADKDFKAWEALALKDA